MTYIYREDRKKSKNDSYLCAARLDLLRGNAHMRRVLVVKDDHDDGRGALGIPSIVSRDEREGTVLERAAGEALCVQVAHLLDLKCALVGDGLGKALAQNEHGRLHGNKYTWKKYEKEKGNGGYGNRNEKKRKKKNIMEGWKDGKTEG